MKHIKKLTSAVLSRITPTLKQIHTVKFKREGEHPAERRESTMVRSNETRIPLLSFRTRSLRTTHFSCAAVSRYPKLAAPRILQRASAAAGPNFSWKHFGAQSKKGIRAVFVWSFWCLKNRLFALLVSNCGIFDRKCEETAITSQLT